MAQPAPLPEPAFRDVIVIGASAGGVEALKTIVERLPRALPATVFVVLHMPTGYPSSLPRVLDGAGPYQLYHRPPVGVGIQDVGQIRIPPLSGFPECPEGA